MVSSQRSEGSSRTAIEGEVRTKAVLLALGGDRVRFVDESSPGRVAAHSHLSVIEIPRDGVAVEKFCPVS